MLIRFMCCPFCQVQWPLSNLIPNVPPELTKPYHGHVLPTSTRLGNLENLKVFYILVGTTMHFEFGKLIHQKLRYGKKHHRLLPKKRGLCELNADDY